METLIFGDISTFPDSNGSCSLSVSSSFIVSGSSFLSGSNTIIGTNVISGSNVMNGTTTISGSTIITGNALISGSVTLNGSISTGTGAAVGTGSNAEGFNTTASGDYSHTEGDATKTGLKGYTGSFFAPGVMTLNSSYGDVSAEFVGTSLILDDEEYDNNYGRVYLDITSITYVAPNTEITFIDPTISTTTAKIGDFLAPNPSGSNIIFGGEFAHAEGDTTIAFGKKSHAEGISAKTFGPYSHAEGSLSLAIGDYSHAEGSGTITSGVYSHAEGDTTQAIGPSSHAEGESTQAIGLGSHAEGESTIASGSYSHAEGTNTLSIGDQSHAEGRSSQTGITTAYYADSVSSGVVTLSSSYGDVSAEFLSDVYNSALYLYDKPFDDNYSYAVFTISQSYFSSPNTIIELYDTSVTTTTAYVGDLTFGVGGWTGDQTIPGPYSHAEGRNTFTTGEHSHAEGFDSLALNASAHAEGGTIFSSNRRGGIAVGEGSHAEGILTQAIGEGSHAEGYNTRAIGFSSHAEGIETQAIGQYSHAEGINPIASGNYSHAEGLTTQAIGDYSHTEGAFTIALGSGSHAGGIGTVASGSNQTVYGSYNLQNNTSSKFVVGIGNSGSRKDGFTVDADANLSGSIMIPTNTGNPSSPKTGSMYFNPSTNLLYIYNGTAWRSSSFS